MKKTYVCKWLSLPCMQKFLVSFFLLFAGFLNILANDSFARSADAASYTELQQQVKITGTVIDGTTKEPLPGVNIIMEGTQKGVFTDIKGNYAIEVPNTSAALVFTFIGYKTERVEIAGRSVVDVAMALTTMNLEEVVVIGYGSRQKKDVTTSVATISSKELENLSSSTSELAMQGKMAGVFVSSGGNTPAARPKVVIRGLNTWQAADPLYVIDGVPIYEFGAGTEGIGNYVIQDIRSPINIMSLIDPDDIESISVLKDASASAIYGMRAANGVILVTTKRGKAGKTNIEFSMSKGWQNIRKIYDVLGTPEMLKVFQEADDNNPSQTLPDEFKVGNPKYLGGEGKTYDWQTPYINKNAPQDNYNLRVSGANEKIDYFVSVGYDKNESAVIQNNLKRYSLSTNINMRINKYFNAGLNYRLSYAKALDNNFASNGRVTFGMLAQYNPWQPIYDTEKKYPENLNGYMPASNLYDATGAYAPSLLWGQQTTYNTFGIFSTQLTNYTVLRNLGTGYIEFKPFEGLTLKGTMSMDMFTNKQTAWVDKEQNWFLQTPNNPALLGNDADPNDSEGNYGERTTTNVNIVSEFSVHYFKKFGSHSIDALFNASDERTRFDLMSVSSDWMQSADPAYRTVGGPLEYNNSSTMYSEFTQQGYLGRLSYNYASKYYLDATIRADGSSNFAKENRWGWFPGIAGAWRLTGESFMESVTWLNDMKLRFGWGQLGNQETRRFAYLSSVIKEGQYSFGSGFGNLAGNRYFTYSFPDFPNRNLSWERLVTSNLAIEAILLKNIDLSFEYYNKETRGILQATRLPGSAGSRNPPIENIASVRNNGIELSLGYRGGMGDFNYRISGNLTTNKNRVKKLYNKTPLSNVDDGNLRIDLNEPINYIWGFKTDGIIQDSAQLKEYVGRVKNDPARNNGLIGPGDYMFRDLNGDSTINEKDKVFLGSTLPGIYYGFSVDLSYKGFDFNIFLQGVGDLQYIAYHRMQSEAMAVGGDNQTTSVRNRWTPTNHTNSMPRAILGDPSGNNRFSDRWVEKAGYLRLAHLELGYSLPKSVIKYLGISNQLRVFVAGNNLGILTKWSGLDPENERFPIPRTYLFGVKASF